MVATIFATSGVAAGIGKTVWREHDLGEGIGSRRGGGTFPHGDARPGNMHERRVLPTTETPAGTNGLGPRKRVGDGREREMGRVLGPPRQTAQYLHRTSKTMGVGLATGQRLAQCQKRGCVLRRKRKVRILAAMESQLPNMARRLEKRDMHGGSVFVLTPCPDVEGLRQVSTREDIEPGDWCLHFVVWEAVSPCSLSASSEPLTLAFGI